MSNEPEVTRHKLLSMQVCVPEDWDDNQVLEFAETTIMCGTENGWFIRKEGDELLAGCPERNPCDKKESFVHITLDA